MLRKKRKCQKSNSTFLLKLFNILNEDLYSNYIHWNKDGTSVVISDPEGFAKKVLPKYFKHNKLSSFIRQLNMYEFHKTKSKPKTNKKNEQIFVHKDFKKSKSEKDIEKIKSRKNNSKNDNDSDLSEDINDKKTIGKYKKEEENLILGPKNHENLDENAKLKILENCLKSNGLTKILNKQILQILLDNIQNFMEKQKDYENEIDELTKKNNELTEEINKCKEKLKSINNGDNDISNKIQEGKNINDFGWGGNFEVFGSNISFISNKNNLEEIKNPQNKLNLNLSYNYNKMKNP